MFSVKSLSVSYLTLSSFISPTSRVLRCSAPRSHGSCRLYSILHIDSCECGHSLSDSEKITKLYAQKKISQIWQNTNCKNIKEREFSYTKCKLINHIAQFFNEEKVSVISNLKMEKNNHLKFEPLTNKKNCLQKNIDLSFESLDKKQAPLVKKWLHQDYVSKYWYGVGLENTLKTIDRFIEGREPLFKLWLAMHQKTPFGFLMTSPVDITEDDSIFVKFCDSNTVAITLDLLIGNRSYLSQGLSVPMIQQLLIQKYSNVTDVFIDPSFSNPTAVYVYKRVGFEPLDTFIPDWCPTTHILMRLKMKELLKSSNI